MANKTPLASWLYSVREDLKPRFREFSWPNKYLPGLFDFSTTMCWEGTEVHGRGVDQSREIALEKSVAEAIERLIASHLKYKSSEAEVEGFAVAGAFDPVAHARFEVLERYFLREHIRFQKKFHYLESAYCDGIRLQDPGSKVSFYRMATPLAFFGVVCSIVSRDRKRSLGFALSDSLEVSIKRSLLEALPNYVWLIEKESSDKTDVIPWHINSKFLDKIVPLLCEESISQESIREPKLFETEVLYSQISVLGEAPIQVARFTARFQFDGIT